MNQEAVVALSMIGVVAIFCQWFAWWIKLPAIVFLLIAGIVLGPLTGWLNPEALFGDLLFPMVSLAVAVILFEGSLTLKFEDIRGLQKVVRNILTFGVMITWFSIAVATHFLLEFSWGLSILFGAIMVVTGPTVIVPMLRTVRPNAKISNVLRWEGIVIDPLGAILAVLVFEVLLSIQLQGHVSVGHTIYMFGKTLVVGLSIGAVSGYLFGIILRKHWLPEYLHNVTTLALVFATFAISNEISEESGLLTVTVLGIWLANMKNVSVENILDFKEDLSILLISGLFILLAARLNFDSFQQLGMGAVMLFLFIQLIARPVKVFLSTIGSDLSWQEKVMISWIGPRGIVAAAVTALFSLRLQDIGVENADLLVPLAFAIIIGTVLVQGSTAKFIANRLGVAEPDDSGFLIIGANSVARVLAQALKENGFRTRLTDGSWTNVKQARMKGLDTYYGNAVSEHADRHLDLIGLGQVLALTPQSELNALAGLRYKAEFGSNHVYFLSTDKEKDKERSETKSRKAVSHDSHVLFSHETTYAKLASLISRGANIKQTKLTENFNFEDYLQQHGRRVTPLFAFNPRRRLRFFTAAENLQPESGWTVVALVQDDEPAQTEAPLNENGNLDETRLPT
ncbi:Sodium/hydrogen exchanger family protein [Methylophaga thiooxydans]|uniref:Sodium/hydrogen exchanger family protein n=1 Tax=Methylophaga thiooxydans TaxID=392484 RepID=A0A0A0BGA5_9GAMM|nr:sodium:proton antiporter [Methylophaga thiooxydans]KGM06134.1 Sodium/hydrogen exchanger family protein [Methylophaga thiooxydans]